MRDDFAFNAEQRGAIISHDLSIAYTHIRDLAARAFVEILFVHLRSLAAYGRYEKLFLHVFMYARNST
jgi:hypothetical protein